LLRYAAYLPPKARRIVIAVYEGVSLLDLAGPLEAFRVAVDFGGRAAAVIDTKARTRLVGDLQTELVPDFFEGFARGAKANVHAKVLYGRSNHHKIEALFKAFGRSLRVACARDRRLARMLPSTKGLL